VTPGTTSAAGEPAAAAVASAADDVAVARLAESGTAPRAGGSGRVEGPDERCRVVAGVAARANALGALAGRVADVLGLALRALSAQAVRWTAGPESKPAPSPDAALARDSAAGAHHGLGSAASPASSSASASEAERWSTNDGRIGLSAAIGRISGAADVWTEGADRVAAGELAGALGATGEATPIDVLGPPASPERPGAEVARATGRCGSAGRR
jgi:hypothetical protein